MAQKNKNSYLKDFEFYYSFRPMVVKESPISFFLNKFLKNYTRIEVAAGLGLSGFSALDIACGDGSLVNKFLSTKYKRVDGVDISPTLIKKANSKKKKNVSFYNQDIDEFVDHAILHNKKYDDIYMLAILEHINWPMQFLTKLSKILNKGGHIIIETPNVAWFPHRLSLLLGKFPITAPTAGVIPGVYDEHIRFFTFDTLNYTALKSGFTHLKFDVSGKFRLIKKLMPKLLSADIVAVYKK